MTSDTELRAREAKIGGEPRTGSGAGALIRRAVGAYVVLAVLLTGVVALGANSSGAQPLPFEFEGADIVGGWCRFDCGWYVGIADDGYFFRELPAEPSAIDQSSVAYFPAYPLAVRAVAQAVGVTPIAAVLVAWLSGLAAVVLFAVWCRRHLERRTASIAVACMVLFPYAWYLFGAGYSDALFLAAAISAFVLLEHDHPLLAGLAGALATASRPVGLAVAVGLVLLTLEKHGTRFDVRALRGRDLGVLLAPAGLVAWVVWLGAEFGEPFAFTKVQAAWDQAPGLHTWFKVDFFKEVYAFHDYGYRVALVIEMVVTLVALVCVWFVGKRFGFAYGAYTALVVAVPAIGTKDFHGMGRYTLAAFPLFALTGELLSNRSRLRHGALIASTALLAVGAFGYGRGWYLS